MSETKPYRRIAGCRGLTVVAFILMLLALLPVAVEWAKSRPGPSAKATPGAAAENALVKAPGATWTFAVSGDSRNCGDVVMPEIAAGARAHHATFYWHLGDFRLGSGVDQDMAHEDGYRGHHVSMSRYEASNWDDFIQNQLMPFGKTPVFLAIGNHELNSKTENEYIVKFANWLNAPIIKSQRLKDNPADHSPDPYYHWVIGGVDFFSLDNAADNQFDEEQMRWFESILERDESDPNIRTIVLGMHRALPHSLAQHSMDETGMGVDSGTRVYRDLLRAQRDYHKNVYILCAHLHLYMANIFNTPYWRSHGGVLPGWIVATAGATRAGLPEDYKAASEAMTNVYGYLLGTVNPPGGPEGSIRFDYYQINESDVPNAVVSRFGQPLVNWCFQENRKDGAPAPGSQ